MKLAWLCLLALLSPAVIYTLANLSKATAWGWLLIVLWCSLLGFTISELYR